MRVVFGECEFDSAAGCCCATAARARFLPRRSSSWSCFWIGGPRLWRRRRSSSGCGRRRSSRTRACTTRWRRSGLRSAMHLGQRGTSEPSRATATRFTATRGWPRHSTPSQRGAQARVWFPRRREWFLADGANVVGRDPECAVRVDSADLSRRHARILVTPAETTTRGSGQQERNTGERRTSHASRCAQRQRPDPGRLRRDDLSNRGHASIHAYPAAGVRQQRMTSRVELDINVRQPKWMDDLHDR